MIIVYWTIIILVVLLFLIFIDYFFGRIHHIKHVKTHTFPTRHSQIAIFTSGPKLFNKKFRDVEQAEHHIHMLFYIFRVDSFSEKLMELLEEKVRQGVEVRILIDFIGSFFTSRKVLKEMKQKGIDVEFCHTPSFPFFFFHLQNRNHRKITVIDGNVGYLGGFNVGKEYIDEHEILSPWRDCHVRFTGEGVQDLQRQFLTDWEEATRRGPTNLDAYFPPLEKGLVEHRFYSYEGVGLEEKFCELLKNAKRKVIIGSPYFIPGRKAFHEVKRTIARGVEVILIVPETSDHLFIKEASYRFLRQLLKIGGSVYQYRDGFYHAKIFIIDNDICSIGTANFDNRSFYFNHETNCIFVDQELVQEMLEIADIDLSKSCKLTADKMKPTNFRERLKEWVALLLSPLL